MYLTLEQWAQLIVLLIAVVGVILAIVRWQHRPRFTVGVPPDSREQKRKNIARGKLGDTSIVSEFRHSSKLFAIPLGDKEELSESDREKLYSDNLRCRDVELAPAESRTSLWVVVQNNGARAARDYLVSIQFRTSGVHIVNVVSESLKVDCLYVNKPNLVDSKDLRPVDERIVHAYNDYMELNNLYGDEVFLRGTLESGMYEMIWLEITIEPDVKQFVITYSLDCSDFWVKMEVFFQGFVVRK